MERHGSLNSGNVAQTKYRGSLNSGSFSQTRSNAYLDDQRSVFNGKKNDNTVNNGNTPGGATNAVKGDSSSNKKQNEQSKGYKEKTQKGRKTPFLNHKSAYDFLAGSRSVSVAEKRRESLEYSKTMSEGMCKLFNKRFVATANGGKCV